MQSFFFATVPFLKLALDNANGAHSELDVADLVLDIFDVGVTLITLGFPLTKLISGAAKAVRIGTKGLVGAAKTRAAIRVLATYMAKTKYTKKIAQEATDFFFPIFTAHSLLKFSGIGSKKLIKLVRKKANDLLENRGVTGIRASHVICRRSPTLICGLTKTNLKERLGKALSEVEEPAKDALFEQARKSVLQPLRNQLTENSYVHIDTLRKAFSNAKKTPSDKVAIRTAYEQLGSALLEQEKKLFSVAEEVFKETLDSEFTKISKGNPSARRQDYVIDFPKIKLELDVTEKAIAGAQPVIRLIGEGREHGPFFLRFIQSVIAKAPANHRVF